MFGIDDSILMDPNYIKILDGIAGSGKSTETVNTLNRLGSTFCLASFSNSLKFAAEEKFGCDVDTICGLAFVNTPFPRSAEKDVEKYDTVILDEVLLDGVDCLNWAKHHVGSVNIVMLTDHRQMLNASSAISAIKEYEKLCKQDNVILVEIDKTKRARDKETEKMYEELYKLDSRKVINLDEVLKILKCDVVDLKDVEYSESSAFLCHSNAAEHEVYKMYGLCNRRDIKLIPKNHISRLKDVDVTKYPICDQITAESKRVHSYLQASNVGSVTRYQGREVAVGEECYFVCKKSDLFTGREIYTLGTRCQTMKSLHIAILEETGYKDPETIQGRPVRTAKILNIKDHSKEYTYKSPANMLKLIAEYGNPEETYRTDMILSENNVIYSSMPNCELEQFATIKDGYVTLNKGAHMNKKSIRSIVKKDSTMHYDFMAKVYEIVGMDVTPPRPNNCMHKREEFCRACDINSAFPSILKFADMPVAGYIYEDYDKDRLNFYRYRGNRVTKGSIITEELANYLGDSEFLFSTGKQTGCELGRYTYEQCYKTAESKKAVNREFNWGYLEKGYYKVEDIVDKGEYVRCWVKHPANNLELVACCIWSKLDLIMFEAADSIGVSDYFIKTDCLYYNGDQIPTLPSWCEFRVESKDWTKKQEDDGNKYHDIIYKTYEDLPTEADIKRAQARERKRRQRERQAAAK